MSRVRASAWTMATSTIFVVLTSLTGMVVTPLLLQSLGATRYGAFRALSDALGYLALLDIGFGGSVMACLAKAVNQRDAGVTRKTLYNAVVSYCHLAVLMLVCGLGFVYLLTFIIKQAGLPLLEVRLAGFILLLPLFLIPISAFRTLAEAQQRGSIVNTLLMFQSLVAAGCAIAAARFGWGLPGQSLAVVIAQIPAAVVLVARGVRQFPGLSRERRDKDITKNLWSLNWQTLVQNVCGRVGLLSDNILVSWSLGPAAVAPFYLTQRLGTLVQSQLQGLGNATWASLIQLHYRGQSQLFERRLTELTAMLSGLGSVALGVVLAYNHEFVRFWTGQASFAGEGLTIIACFNSWMWAISSLWGWPISSAGAVGRWVPYALSFMTLNLCTSVVLLKLVGWMGPPLGTSVSFLLINSWAQPRLLQQLFGVRAGALWGAVLKPLVWALPYCAFTYSIAHSHHPAHFGAVLAEMALSGGSGVLLWWMVGLKSESRTMWYSRVRIAFARA